MTKAQQKVLAETLRDALAATQEKWDKEGPQASAYCYGYLIGTIRETIYHLENQ
jgi:hypothetical protein